MKAIILAGGKGTRLYPITKYYQKQLLPIHDKPMIYYALSIPMMIGINEIAIVSTPKGLESLRELFGEGELLGLKIKYFEQCENDCIGIAYAILRCEEYIGDDDFVLVLGDTVLYGAELVNYLKYAKDSLQTKKKAVIFETYISNTNQFGSILYDNVNKPIDIVEKSNYNKQNKAVPGVYFLTKDIFKYSKNISKSNRGEYEITSALKKYLEDEKLIIKKCGRGIIWIDTGTFSAISMATEFISIVQKNLGIIIACLEEISLKQGWISCNKLIDSYELYSGTEYGEYMKKIAQNMIGEKI